MVSIIDPNTLKTSVRSRARAVAAYWACASSFGRNQIVSYSAPSPGASIYEQPSPLVDSALARPPKIPNRRHPWLWHDFEASSGLEDWKVADLPALLLLQIEPRSTHPLSSSRSSSVRLLGTPHPRIPGVRSGAVWGPVFPGEHHRSRPPWPCCLPLRIAPYLLCPRAALDPAVMTASVGRRGRPRMPGARRIRTRSPPWPLAWRLWSRGAGIPTKKGPWPPRNSS